MENTNYSFHLTAYDVNKLLPQVSSALEKRTELVSRERYPGLWKQTDRFNAVTQEGQRSRRYTKIKSVICLLLGVFLFVPGLVKPQELLAPLIVGIIAIAVGIVGLWRSRKNKKNPFDKSAKLLLNGKDTIAEKFLVVSFSETGMTIPTENASTELVPFSGFECVVETADTLLLVYGERVTLLQKHDLVNETFDVFQDFLSEKVVKYEVLA